MVSLEPRSVRPSFRTYSALLPAEEVGVLERATRGGVVVSDRRGHGARRFDYPRSELAVSGDGKHVLVARRALTELFDARTGALVARRVSPSRTGARRIAFPAPGLAAVTGEMLSLPSLSLLHSYPVDSEVHPTAVLSQEIRESKKTGLNESHVVVRRTTTGAIVFRDRIADYTFVTAAHASLPLVAWLSGAGNLTAGDVQTRALSRSRLPTKGSVLHLRFAADGKDLCYEDDSWKPVTPRRGHRVFCWMRDDDLVRVSSPLRRGYFVVDDAALRSLSRDRRLVAFVEEDATAERAGRRGRRRPAAGRGDLRIFTGCTVGG